MIDVGQDLVVRVGVDGGHEPGDEADALVQRLDHRRKAVGGAGGVRDDRMGRLERVVIHAVHDGRVHVLAAGAEMITFFAPPLRWAEAFSLAVKSPVHSSTTSTFDRLPGQLGRVALGEHLDRVAVHHERIAVDRDRALELAVRRVVPRQVRVGLGAAEIVDGDDLELAVSAGFVQRTQDVAADAAVTVDCNADGHEGLLCFESFGLYPSTGRRRFALRMDNVLATWVCWP